MAEGMGNEIVRKRRNTSSPMIGHMQSALHASRRGIGRKIFQTEVVAVDVTIQQTWCNLLM